MENIIIKGKKYKMMNDYRDSKKERAAFNSLTEWIYDFNFENWYQAGYWTGKYVPYTLFDEDMAVANVSVNIMDFSVQGQRKRYIQIGTVMTDKAYRGQGLSRALLEKALYDWKDKCDLIYLFANDTVLDFYPKFGFEKITEYAYSFDIAQGEDEAVKLNMDKEEDRKLVCEKANKSIDFAKVSMKNGAELVMFYATSFMNDRVYYIKDMDAVAIAWKNEGVLHIHDIFAENEVNIEQVARAIAGEEKQVELGFTPKEQKGYKEKEAKTEDTLFVMGKDKDIWKKERLSFPVMSHA